MQKYYQYNGTFNLECGGTINGLTIAYHTFGTPNADRSNIIWVCHALTANSDVADWWPHTVEKGKFLDPEKYFIVCANVLGSAYGTTGPLSENPDTGKKWYGDFPKVTIRDIVAAHRLLAAHLGIEHVKLLIGSSLGGFQCMEWALIDPDFANNVALIATTPYTTPWAAAFNESQRMAIDADITYGEPRDDAGAAGMAAARSIALLGYRGPTAYNLTQTDMSPLAVAPFKRRVHSYQQHQGDKLCKRFNAYSYYRLTQTFDSHDVARGRGLLKDVLRTFKPRALVVAISSDMLFTPEDHQPFVRYIPNVTYHLIDSSYGHDGFLIEHEKLDIIIKDFLSNPNS